ncbi:MAG: cell division ATP-binding protein FtsE [Gammaproteobacteria bacterium]|jgi:cell division transport system ATP-binding protein|nr:cell division ATP-binding protein FtsE [Gammaproteobacteria bacterium]
MIRFADVSKRYPGGKEALHAVSFEIADGAMVFLTGHSGAGKTTLLKLITLLERPSRGQVVVNNRNLARFPWRRVPLLRREIGCVFQDHRLLADRTVFDNVALPLVVSGVPERELARRVRAALDKVGLLSKEHSYPLSLSGGEQQRVGIARAVVNRPALLLADEPTGNLDPALSDEVMDLFLAFHQYGTTVLIATHDLRHIRRLRKPVLVLKAGRLEKQIGFDDA